MDACNHQVGCALLQTYPDGTRNPIGFWSRSLNPAEKNYAVGEKEYLAIVWAVQLLRPYLEGTHFDLYTDHHAMRWILSDSDHSGRLARWILRLLEFDFTVTYMKGAKNTIEDAISRLPTYGEAKLAPDTEVPCYFISHYEQGDSQEPPTDVGGEGVAVFTAESSPELEEAEEVSSLALEVDPYAHIRSKSKTFSTNVSTKSTAKITPTQQWRSNPLK